MQNKGWSCLVIGFLCVAVACKPITPENGNTVIEPAATMPATGIAQQPTATNRLKPTLTPPAKPTPAPTSFLLNNWKIIGDETYGMQMAIPADWADMSGDVQLDTTSLKSPVGLISLLAANNPRTGIALLADKEIQAGAFTAGLMTNLEMPSDNPVAALQTLVDYLGAENRMVSEIIPVAVNGVPGAYVDVLGNPVLFPDGNGQNLVTRIYLLAQAVGEGDEAGFQPLFLFSTKLPDWERYLPFFMQIVDTIRLFTLEREVVLGEGRLLVAGELENGVVTNGRLDSGVKDVWTFSVAEPLYTSLILNPAADNLDLTLTLFDPLGQTINSFDNGFAGDIETAADLYLTQTGVYVVEVSDFFGEGGSYQLTLSQATVPQFSGGGHIEVGQGIQSEVGINGRQYWSFNGAAGALISVVVEPDANFDAMLTLFSPEGTQLAALDEGFSGDAEVLAGFELPVTGEYTIMVGSFGLNGGSYTLSLDAGGEDTANFYDAGDLIYGDKKQETLQMHEAHTWFFEGKSGDEVIIEVEPLAPALDLDVWFLDQDLNRLAAQDEFLQGEPEMLRTLLPADGQYVVLIRDFNGIPGDYVIRLSAVPVATPEARGIIQYGQTVSGVLDMQHTVVYYFEGRRNETIQVELEPVSLESDFAFALLGPNGRSRHQIDEQSTGHPETFITTLDADGLWGIVISEFFDEGGDYALTINRQ
ncbi:MAG: PPC domain-containing protein [Anaerolineae bacterium]|nr:PPC domain-containing protein [Anaerolineae bacterium]